MLDKCQASLANMTHEMDKCNGWVCYAVLSAWMRAVVVPVSIMVGRGEGQHEGDGAPIRCGGFVLAELGSCALILLRRVGVRYRRRAPAILAVIPSTSAAVAAGPHTLARAPLRGLGGGTQRGARRTARVVRDRWCGAVRS